MQKPDDGKYDLGLDSYVPPPMIDAEKFVLVSRQEIASYKRSARELANSQSWFYQILDSIDAVVFASEIKSHKIIFANKMARSLFGENATPTQYWKVLHPNQLNQCMEGDKSKAKDNPPPIQREKLENFSFVGDKWFKTSSQIITWPSGEAAWLTFAVDVTSDILAQKQTNEARELLRRNSEELIYLQAENKKLQNQVKSTSRQELQSSKEMVERKDAYIRQLGHDMRVTITPILSTLPHLVEQETYPSRQETLKIIHNSFQHMRLLMDRTLELAKLSSVTMKLRLEPVCLRDVADQVIASFRLSERLKGCTFINALAADVKPQADTLRIREVFENLLNNAMKYSSSQNIIQISSKTADKMLVVSIKDSGIGMTQEQLAKMFDDFYRANTNGSEDSLGLGLSICKKIVEMHGGSIWATSSGLDQGTTIFFSLPMV